MRIPLVAASIAALACRGDLTSTSEISGRVAITMSRQILRASPIDSIELQVQHGSSSQVYARALTGADTIVTFDIKVPMGEAQFTARVFSNTGFLLYSGATTQDIKDDARVTIAVTPQNPILSVSPESLRLTGFDTLKFAVTNKGTDTVVWAWDSVAPPCPTLGPLSTQPPVMGTVVVGEVDTARVTRSSGGDASTTLCTRRFLSLTGNVDVRIVVAPD